MPNFEREAKIQAWILFGPIFFGSLMAFFAQGNPFAFFIVILSVVGAWLIVKSKIASKIRTKQAIEWGSKSMNLSERRKYLMGWVLVVVCIFMTLFVHSA